jgi:pimeloyl-ACP methyl ester carboxylesterase
MESISVDGGALAFAESGSGNAVVLIHGFLLDHSTWDSVTPRLASRARVLRPDLRGLGRSSVTPGPYLVETLAGDIAALLDAKDIETATIVGHSLGGFVALAFYRMYRERVSALALVGSRFSPDSDAKKRERFALADRAEREGISPVVQAFLPKFFAASVYTENPGLIESTRLLCERTDPRGAAAILRGISARVDSRDLVEDIDVPFLYSIGEVDDIMDVDEGKVLVPRIPRGRLQLLEGCGHMPMFEAADQLGEGLDDLLASAGKSTAGS